LRSTEATIHLCTSARRVYCKWGLVFFLFECVCLVCVCRVSCLACVCRLPCLSSRAACVLLSLAISCCLVSSRLVSCLSVSLVSCLARACVCVCVCVSFVVSRVQCVLLSRDKKRQEKTPHDNMISCCLFLSLAVCSCCLLCLDVCW